MKAINYVVEFDDGEAWHSDELVFPTEAQAREYGADMASKVGADGFRVVETVEEVNTVMTVEEVRKGARRIPFAELTQADLDEMAYYGPEVCVAKWTFPGGKSYGELVAWEITEGSFYCLIERSEYTGTFEEITEGIWRHGFLY